MKSLALSVLVCVIVTLSNAQPILGQESEARSGVYYAAIAFSMSTGRYGFAFNHEDLNEARDAALRNCRASDGKVVATSENNWCVLALGNKRSAFGWANGDQNGDVRSRAIDEVMKHTSGGYVAVCVHANHNALPDVPYWSGQKDGPASIVVEVPNKETRVSVGNFSSSTSGLNRTFTTHHLKANTKYEYELVAEIPSGDSNFASTRTLRMKVVVGAQMNYPVDLTKELKKLDDRLELLDQDLGPAPPAVDSLPALPLLTP